MLAAAGTMNRSIGPKVAEAAISTVDESVNRRCLTDTCPAIQAHTHVGGLIAFARSTRLWRWRRRVVPREFSQRLLDRRPQAAFVER